MRLAEVLGKFEHEILEMSRDEFVRWIAYFNIKADLEKKAIEKAKRESRRSGGGRGGRSKRR